MTEFAYITFGLAILFLAILLAFKSKKFKDNINKSLKSKSTKKSSSDGGGDSGDYSDSVGVGD